MPVSLKNHLQFKMDTILGQPALEVRIGKRPKSVSSFKSEAVAAAAAVSDANKKKPVILFLTASFQSAAVFFAFLKSGRKFAISYLSFAGSENSPQNRWIEQLAKSHKIDCKAVEFDFANEEHLTGLERLQAETGCLSFDILFDLWSSCNVDEFAILPGDFFLPEIDDQSRVAGWRQPGYASLSLLNFYKNFGGVPYFLNYTASLCHAQAESQTSKELLSLASLQRIVQDRIEIDRHFYEASGFEKLKDTSCFQQLEAPHAKALKKQARPIRERANAIRLRTIAQLSDSPEAVLKTKIAHSKANQVSTALLKASSDSRITGAALRANEESDKESKSESFAFFPTLVTTHRFSGNPDKLLKQVMKCEFFKNKGNAITGMDLHLRDEFQELVKFFRHSVAEYFSKMSYIYDDFSIDQCWANKSLTAQQHHSHSHPNSSLSAVFYLTDGGGKTIFSSQKCRPQLLPQLYMGTAWNSPAVAVSPQKGMLLLFPSHLDHSVGIHADEDVRYTLSFNVILRGNLGELYSGAWTEL